MRVKQQQQALVEFWAKKVRDTFFNLDLSLIRLPFLNSLLSLSFRLGLHRKRAQLDGCNKITWGARGEHMWSWLVASTLSCVATETTTTKRWLRTKMIMSAQWKERVFVWRALSAECKLQESVERSVPHTKIAQAAAASTVCVCDLHLNCRLFYCLSLFSLFFLSSLALRTLNISLRQETNQMN